MIDIISIEELDRLANASEGPCVSIFLPTRHVGEERSQDRIRLKNAVTRAHTELVALGMRAPDATEFLAEVAALPGDADFWNHLDDGLAVFVNRSEIRRFRVALPLEEFVVVADRFHVKPVVPVLSTGATFHVLALSQNQVRLLRGSRHRVSEMDLGRIPSSLADALRYDDRERQLQSHSATRVGTGRVSAAFHGQGGAHEHDTSDLERFLSAVDVGLRQVDGVTASPLVLAGVASTVTRFRHLSRHPRIVDGGIDGDSVALSERELHDRAWPLVEPIFDRARQRAATHVESGAAAVTTTVRDTLIAAHGGRVEAAFVPIGVHRWGTFDADRWEIDERDERQPGDRDLLDAIAAATLEHRGELYVVEPDEVPGPGVVAAELRYRA